MQTKTCRGYNVFDNISSKFCYMSFYMQRACVSPNMLLSIESTINELIQ